ncbi:MAG TPA: TrkA family potassium uptake protein [Desulfotomaculum sp.]|nr:MAG: potassium transporter TrkA [Desulfotomaculum sp. BICA1-6]HBX22032.1 TrkA family potassium uptake protein [Desulfotomaculum sp.]
MKKKSFLVVGLGRFGQGVIEELFERGHDIFAIDQNEEVLEDVRDMIISGAVLDVADDEDEFARLVGEKNFDEAVLAMGSDFEGTLIATSILKEAGIKISVKASSRRRGNVLEKMGADKIVFPERDMGRRLAHSISAESEIDFLELPQGFVVEQLEVGPGFANKTIAKLNTTNRFGIWILLVYHDGETMQPTAFTTLNRGDIMVIFGKKNKLPSFEKENFGKK